MTASFRGGRGLTLGTVRLGDGAIELGPRKQRAVLAMLALEPGRTVSADRLAEGLWAEHRAVLC